MDRKTEVIITGRVNVYPAETADVLMAVRGTDEVAVAGFPHERWGEAVHAVVTLEPGADPDAWERDARDAVTSLVSYKWPKSHAVVASLPHSHARKVRKRAIREPCWTNAEDR